MNTHPQGFAPEKVLFMSPRGFARPAQRAYLRELVQRLESAPQIEAAGLSLWFLFGNAPAFPSFRKRPMPTLWLLLFARALLPRRRSLTRIFWWCGTVFYS